MTPVLAVDPGPELSSWVLWDGERVQENGTTPNPELLRFHKPTACRVIEMVQSYGMPVGREVFETCVWIGRFYEAWCPGAELMYRREVKLHICQDSRAKDANIRQALLDRVGAPGIKSRPGRTYGVKGGQWQALGLAVTWWDRAMQRPA